MSTASQRAPHLSDSMQRIAEGRNHDPFDTLGRHYEGAQEVLRAFLPHAEQVRLGEDGPQLERIPGSDFFVWSGPKDQHPQHYELVITTDDGHHYRAVDPYTFAPQISDFDLHLFGEGHHWNLYRVLGSHRCEVDGVSGVRFATWAPNAQRVSVVGNFNRWDGRCHPMRSRGGSGVWELFIPGLGIGDMYKLEVRGRDGTIMVKTDPYGQRFELRPGTAAQVCDSQYEWGDGTWLAERQNSDWLHAPMSVYELHLGSWQRGEHGEFLNYREIAHRLVPYVNDMGFTHIELLPITEHPFDGSWGYQSTGYFAPTSRFGSPDDFRYFVDHCHRHGIGVILDWVPAHFPKDAFGLARFDGTALYEHEDPRRGEHRDWGTLIYNFGRNEVRNFLLASAVYWMEEMHLDGLRVDAVASMLYLDYSREQGDWIPNVHGGNENLEAIAFMRELNGVILGRHPGALVIAEESTAWPQVTRPPVLGGLGFSMKWNMGWMHDTLDYMGHDPVHRTYHHDRLTFGLLYAFTENFLLPFSHDEVVHGKGSIIDRMPGDMWQKFANLRLLYTYQFTYPGKKLLFMGCEFGQWNEWDDAGSIDWLLLNFDTHRGIRTLIGDLNQLYRGQPALHRYDFDHPGFEWIDCHDSAQSVIAYVRRDGEDFCIVVLNFTPVPREGYRIGVPEGGRYRELLNSDSEFYGGSNLGNAGLLEAREEPWMGRNHSLTLTLPPLAAVVLKPVRD